MANPLCADCLERGRYRAAEEVHHVVKVRDDPSRRLDWDALRALCKSCHSARTARGE
ncbi:MAG: HNH endonuclease [Bryobacterales bacterium]|nr:HNH endonuclease [Bryobacterales bacterium]